MWVPIRYYGTFPVTLTGTTNDPYTGSVSYIGTLCSDLFQSVKANQTFTLTPSQTPSTTNLPTDQTNGSNYATNYGELGYLYNTYGTTPTSTESYSADSGAALQLAIWSLEYNEMPATGPMTLTTVPTDTSTAPAGSPTISPFVVVSDETNGLPNGTLNGTSQNVINLANGYLQDAYGKSEDAYFLNLNTATENAYNAFDGQGLLCTDLLTFNNIPTVNTQSTPSLSTTPNPASVTLGASPVTLTDTASLTNGNDPTGTITFTLYHGTHAGGHGDGGGQRQRRRIRRRPVTRCRRRAR